MSELKVNKISPKTACGTTTLGDSGDTFTIPAGVTITNNGTQTGFGRSGSVNWQTSSIKTATFTAADGEGYFCNTSGGAFTVNLPAGSAGAIVAIADYTRTFDTYGLTISPNGSEKIGGVAADVVLTSQTQTVTLVYVDSTEGWINVQETSSGVKGNDKIVATGGTETTCGNFKIHTFTSPGTFTVSQVSDTSAENTVGYLVTAGGGAGGTGYYAGGGGAGGYREGKNAPVDDFSASPLVASAPTNAVTVTATGYPITVGAGGTASPNDSTAGGNGSNSIFSSITSAGGGGGGSRCESGPGSPSGPVGARKGGDGGSGGGGTNSHPVLPTTAGAGNTPPVSPSQGNPGGYGGYGSSGGGAGEAGKNGTPATTGHDKTGADGVSSSITGSSVTRAGGGGGSSSGTSTPNNAGGAGGGGAGTANCGPAPAVAGTSNTGGGGGGGSGNPSSSPFRVGAAGGSGIVIIRYRYQ